MKFAAVLAALFLTFPGAADPNADLSRRDALLITPLDVVECFQDKNGIMVYAVEAPDCPNQKAFEKAVKKALKREGITDGTAMRGAAVVYVRGLLTDGPDGILAWGITYPTGLSFVSLDASGRIAEDVEAHELNHLAVFLREILSHKCIDGVQDACTDLEDR